MPRSLRALLILAPCLALAGEPKVGFLHSPPVELRANTPFAVEGSLTGEGSLSTVSLKLRAPGKAYESIALELQYGDLYRGTIPAERVVPPAIEYYVEGTTRLGDVIALFGTAFKPIRVAVPGVAPVEAKPEPAPPEEPEEKPAPPKLKCKKTKKGKKCEEEPAPEPVEAKPEPKPEPVEAKPEPRPEPKPDKKPPAEEPRRTELAKADGPKSEPPRPDPPRTEPKAGKTAEKADKPEPPRKRSELEEELAMYAAEETGAVVQRVDDSSARSPLMPTVLTAAHLKQLGVRYVFEALGLVPGLTVTRDVQGSFRLGVRGLRSDPDVLFLLNGQRLNAFYDAKALANLPIDNFERIEIYRGPATADVGLGNFTALVNLVSNRQQGLRASVSGGSFMAFDGHLSAAKTFGGFTIFGDADVVSQQGARRTIIRDGLDTTTPATSDKVTNDNRFLVNVGVGAAYEGEAVGKLTLQGRVMSERRGAYIGRFDVVGNDSQLDWLVVQAQLGWERRIGDGGKLSARLWFDQQNTDRRWHLTPDGYQFRATAPESLFPDGVQEQQRVGMRGFGVDVRGELALPAKNRLAVGLNLGVDSLSDYALMSNYQPGSSGATLREGALSRGVNQDGSQVGFPTDGPAGNRGPAADRLGFGLYAFDTWTPFEALSIQAGLRLDFTQLPTNDNGVFTGATLVPSIGPRVGLALAPLKSLVFRGNYGRSFRAPTPQELAESAINSDFNQGRFVGNSRLEGAYVDAVELGGEWVQSIGDARLRLKGQGFYNRFNNPIAMVDSTGNLAPWVNRPQGVQSFGLEGEGRLELVSRSAVWLNSSWFRVEDLGAAQNGRLITDQPQVRLNAGFSLPLGPFLNLDVILRHASERRSNARTALEQRRRFVLPPTLLVGAQLRTEPLFDRFELVLMGQNVFNLEWADDAARPDRMPGGVPREPFQIFGSLRVSL
ncbi:MAG: TonB-dependent receptor [Myxococcaceae bacterium]|nr:TonB-dependent receptor [Myxococcaceae bacterium]